MCQAFCFEAKEIENLQERVAGLTGVSISNKRSRFLILILRHQVGFISLLEVFKSLHLAIFCFVLPIHVKLIMLLS